MSVLASIESLIEHYRTNHPTNEAVHGWIGLCKVLLDDIRAMKRDLEKEDLHNTTAFLVTQADADISGVVQVPGCYPHRVLAPIQSAWVVVAKCEADAMEIVRGKYFGRPMALEAFILPHGSCSPVPGGVYKVPEPAAAN